MNREMTELYARRASIHYNRGDYIGLTYIHYATNVSTP